jgi:rhamnosyltransferase
LAGPQGRSRFRSSKQVAETISIVIPTKNAGEEFRDTLSAIRNQTCDAEVVVVDSGSSDGTLELAREFGARTLSIPPESFNHGETRNLGIRNSTGQVCIMLVQDAVPIGDRWLETLVAPFSDQRVVGVTGRHVPRPDSDIAGRWQVEYRSEFLGEETRIQEMASWDDFLTLNFEQRLRLVSFDNVCSALRRDFWEKCPFKPLLFAEDLDWGVRAMAAGHRLVYDPAVRVVHSHTRPAAYHMRRSYISGRVVPKLLHMPVTNPGVRDDKEIFAQIGFVCGEVQAMIAGKITDWREFSASSVAEARPWEALLSAVGLRPPPPNLKLNTVRESFYDVVVRVEKTFKRYPGEAAWGSVLVYALAEAVGSFVASYYNWCESQGLLSDGMKRLEGTLAQGV